MNYELALKLKVIGLHQWRDHGSQYYVTPDLRIYVEDFNALKNIDGTQEADISGYVYIPNIEDVLDLLGNQFGEVRALIESQDIDKSFCAYSRKPLEGQEIIIRVFGANVLEALANLAIALYEAENPTPVQSK